MSKIQTALAVGIAGTIGGAAVAGLMLFSAAVEATVALQTNIGIGERQCLYYAKPGQPDCEILISGWQETANAAGPQPIDLPASEYGQRPPSEAPENDVMTPDGQSGQEGNEAVDPEDSAPLAAEDKAYVPPAQAEPPLPQLPAAPVLLQGDYPDCRDDHLHLSDPHDKAININQCTTRLDNYYNDVLTAYRKQMNEHQNEISRIFTEKVAGRMEYSAASRDRFYKQMLEEHANSDPEGKNMSVYRAAVELYNADRNYLSDRYCYNTGCGGYPVPENYGFMNMQTASGEPVEQKKAKPGKGESKAKSAGNPSCKKSRGRGNLLGGIFGGVVGSAAGLNKVGSLIASAAGAVLVGEIACKLSEDEQEKAAEATIAVVEQEKVGAVASWQSPSRGGVSGSSTVTALNTEPNGRKCLTITDVAIIDGEETRISKQMCRGAGQSKYAIMA
ncbi:hypothetical protein [Parasphingorhabdus sp.]|uniref:hypothetical protein n=1 Tax=Parasphingorhabdus sp. TaxID=2709688 RepID=UPI0030023508